MDISGGSEQHRKRRLTPLEKEFLKGGLKGLSGEEMIALVVSQITPRREQKKLLWEITSRYKTLGSFLTTPVSELEKIPGMTLGIILCVKLLREMPTELLREEVISKPVHKSSKEIFDYLHISMRGLKKEVLKVLYINSQNQIIDTEDLFEGTLDGIHIYPREIEASAIRNNATGLVFAHNHPTGNPEPSQNDKQITRDLVFIGQVLGLKVLDHIVIGSDSYFSFADAGLIEKYENDFLNLRIKQRLDTSWSQVSGQPSCCTSGFHSLCQS